MKIANFTFFCFVMSAINANFAKLIKTLFQK